MERKDINAKLGVDEKELDRLAEEYENDTWNESQLGKVVMGRPRLADEETRAVTVRLPISKIADIDNAARREGMSRSSAIRAALDSWLKGAAAL